MRHTFFTVSPVTLSIHMKIMIWQWKWCEGALLCNDFITQGAEHIYGLVIHWFSVLYIVFTRSLHLYNEVRGFLFPFFIAFFQTRNWRGGCFYFTNFVVCIEFSCVCIDVYVENCVLVVWAQIHHLVIWCSLYCFIYYPSWKIELSLIFFTCQSLQ